MDAPASALRPRPAVDKDSAPWWEALARHQLVLARCAGCGAWRWPPRAICGRCGSLEWRWEPASGRGTVASWIVNRHGFGGAFPLPSTVLLVRLDDQDDLLVPGGWAGAPDGADLAVGLPVRVGFEDVPADEHGDAVTLLRWEVAS
jgi:uncharacterized OB-fold protein